VYKNYVGQQLLLVAGQESFEVNGNRFTTLIPLLTLSGERVRPEEFPNRGLVWFMVSGSLEVKRAQPGKLLVGLVEQSQHFGTSSQEKDHFQIRIDSATTAGHPNFIQILKPLKSDTLKPEELLDQAEVRLPYEPMSMVLVHAGGRLLGPFRTECEEGAQGGWIVRFKKAAADRPTNVFEPGAIPTQTISVEVSPDDNSPQRTPAPQTCVYEVALWSDFAAAQIGAKTIRLSTEEEAISRVAKGILSRTKRQELIRDLKELGEIGRREPGSITQDDIDLLQRVVDRTQKRSHGIEALVEMIVDSGRFDALVNEAVEKRVEREIDERVLEINASAQEKAANLTRELEFKRKELERLSDEIDRSRRQSEARLQEQFEQKRVEKEKELFELEEMLKLLKEEIESQRKLIEGALKGAADRFESGREKVIEDFLAIEPMLGRIGLVKKLPEPTSLHDTAIVPSASGDDQRDQITLPPPWARDEPSREQLSELEFFERFCAHVHANGFRFDRSDLLAFHLSVKCNNLVILGGVSGAGKSSLPKLYADAMAGDNGSQSARYLNIDVNPSWTNPADLLGYVNLIDRRFYPGTSGIFTFLAQSALEAELKRDDTSVYITCLDEMNLAQVEHYFSGFVQALSRNPADRHVNVFDASSLDANDPLRRWSRIHLGDHVRFIGTVNFDETTRVLSQRMLDRADLITLEGRDLMDLNGTASTGLIPPTGSQLHFSDMREWISERPLSKKAVALLNELQGPLQTLGCPLTSRRHAGIQRFVSSATPALFEHLSGDVEWHALDMQIAQRVVPQIKGLFRREAQRALEQLDKSLDRPDAQFMRSRRLIRHLREGEDDVASSWLGD